MGGRRSWSRMLWRAGTSCQGRIIEHEQTGLPEVALRLWIKRDHQLVILVRLRGKLLGNVRRARTRMGAQYDCSYSAPLRLPNQPPIFVSEILVEPRRNAQILVSHHTTELAVVPICDPEDLQQL